MKRDRWVLGDAGQQDAVGQQYNDLANDILAIYSNDFVNAWRAENGLGPIAASQIESSRYNSLDGRLSKSIQWDRRRIELIAQCFNVLGTNNLGGVGSTQVTNALSASFGRILTALPRQQGEIAVRFVF